MTNYLQIDDDFIEKYEIQSNGQYGISSSQSTILAAMEFIEIVVTANDKNQHTIDVFTDLPNAFDTTDSPLLLQTLEQYGTRGVTQN